MGNLHEIAYRIEPALWVRNISALSPRHGNRNFCARRLARHCRVQY